MQLKCRELSAARDKCFKIQVVSETVGMSGKKQLFSNCKYLVTFPSGIQGMASFLMTQLVQHKYYSTTTSRTYYYDVLGIPSSATQGQIKNAYYLRSKLYHPDVCKDPDAHRLFSTVAEAYEILGNVQKRRLYDQRLGQKHHFQESNYQRSEGFSSPKRYPPTGRTSTYNFDEFYRMHYADIRKKKQYARDLEEKWQAEREEMRQRKSIMYLVTTVCMGTFVCFVKVLINGQR